MKFKARKILTLNPSSVIHKHANLDKLLYLSESPYFYMQNKTLLVEIQNKTLGIVQRK